MSPSSELNGKRQPELEELEELGRNLTEATKPGVLGTTYSVRADQAQRE